MCDASITLRLSSPFYRVRKRRTLGVAVAFGLGLSGFICHPSSSSSSPIAICGVGVGSEDGRPLHRDLLRRHVYITLITAEARTGTCRA